MATDAETSAAEPTGGDPTSDEATESASPSATATAEDLGPYPLPGLPPETQNNDQAGAEAFVQYVIDLLNYSYSHADSSYLRSISDPECVFCLQVAGDIDDLAARGEHQVGGRMTWQLTEVRYYPSDDIYFVEGAISASPYQYVDASDVAVRDLEGLNESVVLSVATENGAWLLYQSGASE